MEPSLVPSDLPSFMPSEFIGGATAAASKGGLGLYTYVGIGAGGAALLALATILYLRTKRKRFGRNNKSTSKSVKKGGNTRASSRKVIQVRNSTLQEHQGEIQIGFSDDDLSESSSEGDIFDGVEDHSNAWPDRGLPLGTVAFPNQVGGDEDMYDDTLTPTHEDDRSSAISLDLPFDEMDNVSSISDDFANASYLPKGMRVFESWFKR